MNGALLSRFDLVFILMDTADANMDRFLSDHIMKIHSGRAYNRTSSQRVVTEDEGLNGAPLEMRLKQSTDVELVPTGLFRKYISYARHYSQPV